MWNAQSDIHPREGMMLGHGHHKEVLRNGHHKEVLRNGHHQEVLRNGHHQEVPRHIEIYLQPFPPSHPSIGAHIHLP